MRTREDELTMRDLTVTQQKEIDELQDSYLQLERENTTMQQQSITLQSIDDLDQVIHPTERNNQEDSYQLVA